MASGSMSAFGCIQARSVRELRQPGPAGSPALHGGRHCLGPVLPHALILAPGENPRTCTLVTLCRQKSSQRQPASQLKLSAHHDGPNGDLLASKGAVPDDLQSVERGNGNILELF